MKWKELKEESVTFIFAMGQKNSHILPFIFSTNNSNHGILDNIITLPLLLDFALCDKSYSPKDNAPKCTYHYPFLLLFQPTI